MENFDFSIMDVKDIPDVNKLINGAYRGDSAKKGWTHEADILGGIRTDEEQLLEIIKKENADIFVLRIDGTIQACVYLEQNHDYAYLGSLTVNPTLQGRGIGKRLLQFAEVKAKEWQKPKIRMTVISKRNELIDWYIRNGYVNTNIKQPFPMDNPKFGEPKEFLEFIVLEKAL